LLILLVFLPEGMGKAGQLNSNRGKIRLCVAKNLGSGLTRPGPAAVRGQAAEAGILATCFQAVLDLL